MATPAVELTNSTRPTHTADYYATVYLSEKEFAALVHRDLRTIRRFHMLRIGPPRLQFGKLILYQRTSVDTWLRRLEEPDQMAKADTQEDRGGDPRVPVPRYMRSKKQQRKSRTGQRRRTSGRK